MAMWPMVGPDRGGQQGRPTNREGFVSTGSVTGPLPSGPPEPLNGKSQKRRYLSGAFAFAGAAARRDPLGAIAHRLLLPLPEGRQGLWLEIPHRRQATLAREEGNPFVITGQRTNAALVNLEKPWRQIREAATVCLWSASGGDAAGLVERLAAVLNRRPTFGECQTAAAKAKQTLPVGLSDLRLHDLRHAFASVAVSSGMGHPIVGKMLGHTQAQTTQRYAHLAADPVKAAAAAVAGKIAASMNGKGDAEVLKMGKAS